MYLEEIIENVQLESDKFECKAKLNRDDVVGWLKTIAGFANAFGGDFYIGVEDKTNKLIGFDRIEADNERNYFNNQVNEHLVPRPQMAISFIRYEIKGKERFVIRVQVGNSVIKPVILKYKNVPSIYMRRDGFTNGATYEEIIDMSVKSKNTQYDILTSDVKYDASKFTMLREFYTSHNDGKELTEKALQSMGFYNEEGLLANGALLFADDYQGKKTEIQVDMYKDRPEISSPGSFYRGEKLGKTYELSGIISKRRNSLIASVLVSCNVMEAAGTGFDKIVEEYKGENETHRPYIYSSSDHFTLVLPDLTYMDGVEDSSTPILTFVPVADGTDLDDKVLSFCYYQAHKVSEIAEYLGISDSTYLRKQVLGNLEKQGYLESSKISRAMYFKTNPDMVTVN